MERDASLRVGTAANLTGLSFLEEEVEAAGAASDDAGTDTPVEDGIGLAELEDAAEEDTLLLLLDCTDEGTVGFLARFCGRGAIYDPVVTWMDDAAIGGGGVG